MSQHTYDVVVIGAGSGGYAAARTARDLDASVALVDHGPLGGLCILRGCMPSKTLIASGDAAHEVRESDALGIHAGEPHIDFAQIMSRKDEIIRGFADDRIAALDTFPLYSGAARFLSRRRIAVGDRDVLEAKRFIIATGSVIAPSIVPGLDEVGYIDSDAALTLTTPPRSLIVLGGGYVATELGQFYARMGVATTLVLRAAHLLSNEDDDVGDALTRYLREEGLRIETLALVVRAERRGDRKAIVYAQHGHEHTVEGDEIFYALGRVPNVMGLELETAGVRYHPIEGIEVDATLRTSNPEVFAVGDVLGGYLLVHVAIAQGEIAARNAVCKTGHEIDYRLVKTHAVFSDPQVAVVGETEKELRAHGVPYLVATYPFADHGKAIAMNRTKGFVKMMASAGDGKILGAAVIGPDGSDLIHEVIVAMNYGATVHDFVKIPHLHPTLAEIWTYPAEEIIVQMGAANAMAAAV
ncbi:MAG: dihydrolipoyl dehydrogenase [Candidatus Eremiobacteraeota bacterium]|nr:dihydrolipoyl dehydrogenase [Candidatus Eremiobacteraeota bacterium]